MLAPDDTTAINVLQARVSNKMVNSYRFISNNAK